MGVTYARDGETHLLKSILIKGSEGMAPREAVNEIGFEDAQAFSGRRPIKCGGFGSKEICHIAQASRSSPRPNHSD